jgi:hypothetical protein
MKLRWLIPVAVLIPLRLSASDTPVGARVATVTINPREVTVLRLRPEFESTIRMPEEITSVILGSPGEFKAEHNEGEPEYVCVGIPARPYLPGLVHRVSFMGPG